MVAQNLNTVNSEFSGDLPAVWSEPAQVICAKMAECDEEIDWLDEQVKQIEARYQYWLDRRSKLDRELQTLLSSFDRRLFELGEPKIHQLFISQFSKDFIIEREVWGEYEADIAPKRPRIDFMIYPKPHVLALSFPPVWVGVEAKAPKDDRQAIEVIQQAENYRMAIFSRPDANIVNVRPDMVLIYPAIDFFFRSPDDAKLLKMHAHKSRVGSIRYHQKTPWRDAHWSIKFADETAFFYSDTGLSNNGAVLNNIYLGNGRVK